MTIKRFGTRLILSFFIVVTLIQALPRTYYAKLPPGINPGNLQLAINALDNMRYYDTLYLSLDSHGGAVSELDRFMKSYNKSPGRLVCTIEHIAASAAAMISQTCHKIYMRPYAKVLFHMPRYMESKKTEYGRDLKIHIISRKAKGFWLQMQYLYFKARMMQFGIHEILTEDEWNRMLDGEDIVISGKELAKRDLRVRIME